MTQSEFIKLYCENAEISEESLNKLGTFAVACDCKEESCKGWSMVSKENLIQHAKLYIKD